MAEAAFLEWVSPQRPKGKASTMERDLTHAHITHALAIRQRVAERVIAMLLLWLLLLSAAVVALAAMWLAEVQPETALQWLSRIAGSFGELAGFLGFAGCVGVLVALWRACDKGLQAWIERGLAKRLREGRFGG